MICEGVLLDILVRSLKERARVAQFHTDARREAQDLRFKKKHTQPQTNHDPELSPTCVYATGISLYVQIVPFRKFVAGVCSSECAGFHVCRVSQHLGPSVF